MKKHTFIFLLFAFFCIANSLLCNAQEKAKYKCTYKLEIVRDTLNMDFFGKDSHIVQIGDNYAIGYSHNSFYVDSLRTHAPNEFNNYIALLMSDFKAFSNAGNTLGNTKIYKDYKKQEIKVTDIISTHHFVYHDELQPQDWEILSDTMTISGYHSQKAVCHYRGRDWEAWFTTDIPLNEGPWKFYGLPGLITKLHDTQKHYSFELTGFQKTNEKIEPKISKDRPSRIYQNQNG